MKKELTLNNNPINRHAKRLLTRIDPDDPEHLQPNETMPYLYLLLLIEWYLNHPDQMYHPANQLMMQEKLYKLMYDMKPIQAWKWLGLTKRHVGIQGTQNSKVGGREATEILRMQLFYEKQEQEEVIKTP